MHIFKNTSNTRRISSNCAHILHILADEEGAPVLPASAPGRVPQWPGRDAPTQMRLSDCLDCKDCFTKSCISKRGHSGCGGGSHRERSGGDGQRAYTGGADCGWPTYRRAPAGGDGCRTSWATGMRMAVAGDPRGGCAA